MQAGRRRLLSRFTLALLGCAVAVVLLPRRYVAPAREAAAIPLGWAERGWAWVGDGADGLWRRWREKGDIQEVRARMARLRGENERLRAELHAARRRLTALAGPGLQRRFERIAANVVGGDASPWRQSVVVDAGRREGVAVGMPAVWAGSAVGRVVAAGPFSARVRLLTDPASRVAARSSRSGARGALVGGGAGRLKLENAPHYAEIRVGDTLVTAGVDGVFPPDFPVGVCERVSAGSGEFMLSVDVRPALEGRDLESLEVLKWRAPEAPPGEGREGRR